MPKTLLNETDRVLMFPDLSLKILPRAWVTVPTEKTNNPQIVLFAEKKYLSIYSVTDFERRRRADALQLAKDKAEEAARAAADAHAIAEARKNEANAALDEYNAVRLPTEPAPAEVKPTEAKPVEAPVVTNEEEPKASKRGKKHHG